VKQTDFARRIQLGFGDRRSSCSLHPGWWEDELSWDLDDYEEGQTPFSADAESLRRFLESEILSWYESLFARLGYRPLRAAPDAALDPADGCPADAGGSRDLFLCAGRVVAPRLDYRGPPLRRQLPIAFGFSPRRQFDAPAIRQPPHLGKTHAFGARHP
jgi:hypothetical protein